MKNLLKKLYTCDNVLSFFCISIFVLMLWGYLAGKEYIPLLKGFLISTSIFTVILFLINKFRYKTANILFKYLLFWMFLFIFSSTVIAIIFEATESRRDFESHIAYTKDIELANEIQNIDKAIVIEKYSPNGEYTLKLLYGNYPKYRDYIILKLAEKYGKNDNVKIIPEMIYYDEKNPEKFQRELERATTRRLKRIDGVTKVDFKILKLSTDNALAEVSVDISVLKGYDKEHITKIIENYFYKTNLKLNINFVDDEPYRVYSRYENRLDELNENNDTKAMDELLKEAESQITDNYYNYNRLENHYKYLLNEPIRKQQQERFKKEKEELDGKILKEPNNYRLYIQKGDMTYGLNAIVYYEKAILLNPKIKDELFSRIEYNILTAPQSYLSYENALFDKCLDYYETAIKSSKYKDIWNLKLGDAYYYQKDYLKALEYYNKIENIYNVYDYKIEYPIKSDDTNLFRIAPERRLPVADKVGNPWWLTFSPYPFNLLFIYEFRKASKMHIRAVRWNGSDFLYRFYYAQKQSGLYEEALKTCEIAIEKAKNENKNPAYIYDSIIKIDLKMKKYKQAYRDSKNGSYIVQQIFEAE